VGENTLKVNHYDSWLRYHNKNHNILFSCVLGFEAKSMLNNEREICMYRLSTNKLMNDSNQLNNFFMSYSNINKKRNARLYNISKMIILSFGVPKPY
jgi:hypothetical protein